jgi:hypothetical protein
MTSFRGKASRATMTSPGVKLTAQACHATIKVNKYEELNYLFTNMVKNVKFLTKRVLN